MPYAFLPVFLFVVCAVFLAVGLLVVASLFNPGRPGAVKRMPYESGMDPIHDTRRRFDVRFHLLAIAFLVFDVELLFLYPWAVAAGGDGRLAARGVIRVTGNEVASGRWSVASEEPLSTGHSPLSTSPSPAPRPTPPAPFHGIASRRLVFWGVMVFLALLTLGFVYDWRKGVFQWR